MFGSNDQLRLPDTIERKAHGLMRAVERARAQFSSQKSRSGPSSPDDPDTANGFLTHCYLDRLPAELIIEIFALTEWRDLVAMRRVSHGFKDLIDMHEHVIVSQMLVPGTNIGLLSVLFAPPKARTGEGRRPTLRYIHGLETRNVTCSELAYYLAAREINTMFNRHSSTQPAMTKREKKELDAQSFQAISIVRKRLTKQLYYVDHFLTYTRLRMDAATAILAADNSDVVTQDELATTYRELQSSIISTFSNSVLISTHHAMNFLVNSIRLSISPEPPHNSNDDTVALMLRCSTPLKRCLELFVADSPLAPSRLRRQFMNNMQDEREEAEARGLSRARSVKEKRRSSAGSKTAARATRTPRVGEIWFESAKAELQKRGISEHRPDGIYFFPECQGELLIGCPNCQAR